MAMPKSIKANLTPREVIFCAENDLITVLPRSNLQELDLICGNVPSLRAGKKTEIPLWLALILKRQRKVQFIQPDWMQLSELEKYLEFESEPGNTFSTLPFHWIEISDAFLLNASDDVADCDKVRIVLQNLREVRDLKAREGFKQISETHLRVDNLGAMEINLIRPQFLIGMNQIRRLHAGYVPEEPKNIDDDEYDVTK